MLTVLRLSPASRELGTMAVLAVALALVSRNVESQTAERHTLRGDRVSIYNLVGSIRVEGSGGTGETAVEVTKRGPDGARLRVETGDLRGRESLRVIYPERRITFGDERGRGRWFDRNHVYVREDGTFSDGGDWRGRDRYEITSRSGGFEGWADIVVRIPNGRAITLHLAAGEATVTGVDGEVIVDVQAASVTTSNTKGRLTLDTGSGQVQVSDASGSLVIDSGSGEVQLNRVSGSDLTIDSGSGSVSGGDITVRDLEVDSGSGSIRLRNVTATDIEIDSGSGAVELDLASDIDRLMADAGSGRLTLHLPESLGAQLTVETGRHALDIDFPITVTRRSDDYIRGTIGDGRGEIRIDTGSGGVRLRRRGG